MRRRLKVENPFEDLDEVRFRQRAPKRTFLTKREAKMLLSPIAIKQRPIYRSSTKEKRGRRPYGGVHKD